MPRKKESARVLGPFKEGDRYRVIVVDAGGRRTSRTCDSSQAARRLVTKLARGLDGRTIESIVDEWSASRVRSGDALLRTVQDQADRVRGLLGDLLPLRIEEVTERRAAACYEAHTVATSRRTGARLSAASHRFDLQVARHLWNWSIKHNYTSANPWTAVEPIGRVSRGKLVLRPSEAKAFSAAAEAAASDGDGCALAALLCLSLGLRASEALAITPRDIDGSDLFVAGTKTAAAKRRLQLSPTLKRLLDAACQGRERSEPLCTVRRQTLYKTVVKLCKRAGVPMVCTHALRGTHASLGVESGASVEAVARALGHTSTRITRAHYISEEAADGARIAAYEATLNRS